MDYSTIDLSLLRSLEVYQVPPGYYLQKGSGNGCAGDPPGCPTYFTRSIYTSSGNNPSHSSPQVVITFEGVHYVVCDKRGYDHHKELLSKLYAPLPIDHVRTRLWILGTYKHQHHCYNGWGDDMVIYPVPDWQKKTYKDDHRWHEQYRQAAKAEVAAFNQQLEDKCKALADPTNHNAVRLIRGYYPSYEPELGLIHSVPSKHVGQWWETEAMQPSEEDCASTQRWGNKHPFNSTWCQWCGRSYLKERVVE